MPLHTLKELLVQQLDELDGGAKHAREVLPKLARAASAGDLGRTLRFHADQKREQVNRLERILGELDVTPRRPETRGMRGLIEDCLRLAENQKVETHVRDAALIAGAQRVVHDEIAAYGCAKTWAHLLGLEKAATDLETSLREERETDNELTRIANRLNKDAVAPVSV